MSEKKDERDIDEILASIDKMLAEKDGFTRETDERKENVEIAARNSEEALNLSSSAKENIQPNAKLQPFDALDEIESNKKEDVPVSPEPATENKPDITVETEAVVENEPRQRIVLTEENLEPSAQESLPLWAAQSNHAQTPSDETSEPENDIIESDQGDLVENVVADGANDEGNSEASEDSAENTTAEVTADIQDDHDENDSVEDDIESGADENNDGWENIKLIEPDAEDDIDPDIDSILNDAEDTPDSDNIDEQSIEPNLEEPNLDEPENDAAETTNHEPYEEDEPDENTLENTKDEFEDVFNAIAADDTITFDINEAMDEDTVYDIQVLDKELVEAFVHDVVEEDDIFQEAATHQDIQSSENETSEAEVTHQEEFENDVAFEMQNEPESEEPLLHHDFSLAAVEIPKDESDGVFDTIISDENTSDDAADTNSIDTSETDFIDDIEVENIEEGLESETLQEHLSEDDSIEEDEDRENNIAQKQDSELIEDSVAQAIDNDEAIYINPDELDPIIELISDEVRIKINHHLQQILPELISDALLEHLASPTDSNKSNKH